MPRLLARNRFACSTGATATGNAAGQNPIIIR
jgi:hypothetical protein